MSKSEMVPVKKRLGKAPFKSLCGPEWKLLCWIRRELQLVKEKDLKKDLLKLIRDIVAVMDREFSDWPEDPK